MTSRWEVPPSQLSTRQLSSELGRLAQLVESAVFLPRGHRQAVVRPVIKRAEEVFAEARRRGLVR